MALPAPISPEEYLIAEEAAELRHELVNGVVYAMSGASPNHIRIVTSLTLALGTRLRGTRCEVANHDARVHVEATEAYFYPDVVAFCGGGVWTPTNSLRNPITIIEVLSPSTADYNRGAKFAHYRLIPSLQSYVLVAQDRVMVERFERREGGSWAGFVYQRLEDVLSLPELSIEVPLKEIYERLEIPPDPRMPRLSV